MNDKTPELILIIPTYNEEASLKKVIEEWMEEVENWCERFLILVINDGSTDKSLKILEKLNLHFGNRLEIITHKNKGHGQSCLAGYYQAIQREIPWIFQLDSDGQCNPMYFYQLWRERKNYDVLYGVRVKRDDGIRRVIASKVLKVFLFLFFKCWCPDANVPYRLMKTSVVASVLQFIPSNFFLANIGLAVLLKKNLTIKHFYTPIQFRERYGGEPSVKFSSFGKQAKRLYRDLQTVLESQKK